MSSRANIIQQIASEKQCGEARDVLIQEQLVVRLAWVLEFGKDGDKQAVGHNAACLALLCRGWKRRLKAGLLKKKKTE